jgi:hypothetical protein
MGILYTFPNGPASPHGQIFFRLSPIFPLVRTSGFSYNAAMLKTLKLPVILFIAALGISSVIFGNYHVEAGTTDFFEKHNFLFLVFIAFFPRLTLLFSSVPFGGFFWWLGFFFMPRLLVAVLATVAYGHTNPLLVGVAWFVALTGEVMEKKKISGSRNFVFRTYRGNPFEHAQYQEPTKPVIDDNGVIEAEFTKKD